MKLNKRNENKNAEKEENRERNLLENRVIALNRDLTVNTKLIIRGAIKKKCFGRFFISNSLTMTLDKI